MGELKGLATGIGSLPQGNADAALDLVFKYVPHIPFWPQLPKRDLREGMIAQFSEHIPCLRISPKGLVFDSRDKEKELEEFYAHIIARDINYFGIGADFALGLQRFYQRLNSDILREAKFLKGQITGPFTFAASIKDEEGRVLLHDPVFRQVILKALAFKALWQIKYLEKFRKKIILFLDEPYLGCFGSAYTPINREEVVRDLSELTAELKSTGALIGVHCCGNTDWSIFTEIPALDIINFDAFSFQEKFLLYAADLDKFFRRGGAVCWGIVPTQEFSGAETKEGLRAKIIQGIDALAAKGIPRNLLLENLCLSPSCGLGTLDIGRAEKIWQLLAGLTRSFT